MKRNDSDDEDKWSSIESIISPKSNGGKWRERMERLDDIIVDVSSHARWPRYNRDGTFRVVCLAMKTFMILFKPSSFSKTKLKGGKEKKKREKEKRNIHTIRKYNIKHNRTDYVYRRNYVAHYMYYFLYMGSGQTCLVCILIFKINYLFPRRFKLAIIVLQLYELAL